MRKVRPEFDLAALAPDGLGVEVRQDQSRIAPVGKAHVLGRQDRQGEVTIPADELVGLRVAVREGGLDQRASQESDLAGGVGVLVVEIEGLPDKADGSARAACRSAATILDAC